MLRGTTFGRVLAVAGLTYREAMRRRIVLAAVLMAAAFLAVYGFGLHVGQASVWSQSDGTRSLGS